MSVTGFSDNCLRLTGIMPPYLPPTRIVKSSGRSVVRRELMDELIRRSQLPVQDALDCGLCPGACCKAYVGGRGAEQFG